MIPRTESCSSPQPTRGGAATPEPRSLAQLLALAPADIERLDVARVNLLCAEGLPGAERLNIPQCLNTLDRWADSARRYTRDCAGYYQRDPAAYYHHKGFSKLVSMAILLKRGIGIGYQPTVIGNYNFSDSRDDLLHGLLTRKLGTCTSLPVLCVAIGRRLGYPLHLAVAKGHVFCQWLNDDRTHVNFEISGNDGDAAKHDDAHYHAWPRPMTHDDIASGLYLRALTRMEELALFLETRGHCLVDNKRFDEARKAYEQAHRAAPHWSQLENHLYSLSLHEAQRQGSYGFRIAGVPGLLPQTRQPTINCPLPNRGLFPTVLCVPGLTH